MTLRIVDSITNPAAPGFKHLLVEEGTEYSVLGQVQGRNALPIEEHLNETTALLLWRKLLTAAFYAVSHHPGDSLKLAERRIQELH